MSGFMYNGNNFNRFFYSKEDAIAKLEAVNGYHFSEQQLEILNSDKGIKMVAVAGSGKTTSIVNLVVKRIMTGEIEDASKLLMTTYSKAGADNMTLRINDLLKRVGLKDVFVEVRTLHSLYYNTLRHFGNNDYIITGSQRLNLIRQAVKNCKVSLEEEEIASLDSLISYQVNNMLTDALLYKSYVFDLDIKLEEYSALVQEFRRLKGLEKCIDFDDLQLTMYYSLCVQKNQAVLKYLHESYEYLYVDEFQDTSLIQYKILQAMITDESKLVVCGDDDQCLVEGTEIVTSNGVKKIEDIVVGDKVLTGIGHGETGFNEVEKVMSHDVDEDIYVVTTKSGRVIKATGNHLTFSRVDFNSLNKYYVYLIYKKDIGYFIDISCSDLNDNNVDKIWLIHSCDSIEEAKNYESYYLSKYKFNNGLCFEIWGELLLKEKNMYLEFPYIFSNSNVNNISLTMFGSFDKELNGHYYNELFSSSLNKDYLNVLSKNLDKVNDLENITITSSDYDEQFKIIKKIESDCFYNNIDLNVKIGAMLTENYFNFTPFSHLLEGMLLVTLTDDGSLIEDEIVSVEIENYKGTVYDLNISKTRNFVANNIIVKNCIYSWRGAKPDLLLNIDADYHIDKLNLDTNYRCRDNILQFGKFGIENASRREMKNMKSIKEAGVVNFVYKDSKDLYSMSQYVANKIEHMIRVEGVRASDICVLVRYNAHAHVLNQMLLFKNIMCNTPADMRLSYQTIFKDIENIVELCGTDDYASYDRNACSAVFWKLVKYLGAKNSALLSEFMQNTGTNLVDALSWILANVYSIGTYKGRAQVNAQIRSRITASFKKLSSDSQFALRKVYDLLTTANKDDRLIGLLWLYKDGTSFMSKKRNKQRNADCYFKFFETLAKTEGFEGFRAKLEQIRGIESTDIGQMGDSVRLSTIHGAKGLEWKHVILLGYDNISFPDVDYMVSKEDISSIDMQSYIDGERRLAYVAVTRAIDTLTIVTDRENASLFCLESLGGYDSRLFNGSYLDFAKFVKSHDYKTPANMHIPEWYTKFIFKGKKAEVDVDINKEILGDEGV